jgi:transposase
MAETRRKFDQDFRDGAVRIVLETGKPIAQVARDLGIHDGTLGNWVAKARETTGPAGGQLSISERDELLRLRKEIAELTMERDDAPMFVKWPMAALSLV